MSKREPPAGEPERRVGPRGGTTTITARGDVRTNLWLPDDQHERLRRWAFKLRRTKADLIREALERLLSDLEAQERGAGRDRGKGGSA